MIIISKTSALKIRDGLYTSLLGKIKILGGKVFIPYDKQVDSYIEYRNINEDALSRLKRSFQGSNNILSYSIRDNEIISISFPDESVLSKPHKSAVKSTISNSNQIKKESISKTKRANSPNSNFPKREIFKKVKQEKKDRIVLGPIIFHDSHDKRKRIHRINFKSKEIVFQDGFVLLEYNGELHEYIFTESKEFYQRLNSKNKTSTFELKLKGGEIFNKKSLLEYMEWLIVGSSNDYKPVITKTKEKYPGYQERTKVSSPITDVEKVLNEKTHNQKPQTDNKVESMNILTVPTKPIEKQIDVISSIEDNDWNKIRFQRGMVQISYSSKVYGFTCIKSKQEYDYIKSFYQTHHYQYTVTLRNNAPIGVSIPDKIFDFLELGHIIHQMKKSRDMRDLWKVKKLTDSLSNRAEEVLKFFNKDKTYYFTKLSEKHSEDFKIRVVWEPNIWSGSSYDIHLTFLFTYLKNDIYYLIWESTEVSTATYIFKFTSLEKYNLGVEHFVSCISDINCYKGRMVLRRGNKYLEKVKFISHSSILSNGIDYEWNIKLRKAILQ